MQRDQGKPIALQSIGSFACLAGVTNQHICEVADLPAGRMNELPKTPRAPCTEKPRASMSNSPVRRLH